MFYPVYSLRRGGRFYLCWVADSWPLRFATITHRQLWSQDIRNICDDLLEVITNESGRPSRRFSLRLSSQLMRGLVRLYQRKVTIFLGELCMLNANVTKHVNKKFAYHEEVRTVIRSLPPVVQVVQELPENEERVEEMIQMSGNVVANIDEITLKESAWPEVQPMLDDNFGELHPDQPLQLLADKTLELMLAHQSADQSAPQTSLEPLDWSTDRSHDKSRLAPDLHMERISEHELSLFRKSVGDELLPILDVTKELPGIPELPEILPPALPDPQLEIEKEITEKVMEIEQDIPEVPVRERRQQEPEEVVLEELEEMQPPGKRRRMKNKVIDKQIKLTSNYLRARIDNIGVELRCENASEDIASITVPAHSLLGRAARAGGHTFTRLFLRNLGPVSRRPLIEREMEEVVSPRVARSHIRSVLEKIVEEVEPALPAVERQQMEPQAILTDPIPERIVPEIVLPEDIAELPTQVIETLSQQARKRSAEQDIGGTPKSPRRSGYKSFKHTQPAPPQTPYVEPMPDYGTEVNKENISDNIPQESLQPSNIDRELAKLSSMLQEAGLADLPRPEPAASAPQAPRAGSDRTETPLGSLDRTKVSLGDSDRTTDSTRFLRENWGAGSTMARIVICLREGVHPLDVHALIARGPAVTGLENFVAARCFTSILKLKQHRFIKVRKDPETLEILDITFGDKFDNM